MRFFAGLIFLIIFHISVFAQTDKDKRVSESEVTKEEKFFSAYQKFLMADYEAAAKAFLKITEEEKDPVKLYIIYFQLSRCYESLKDYTNSIKYGQKSVALNDKNEFYVMQLAEAYEANKELEKVAKLYADTFLVSLLALEKTGNKSALAREVTAVSWLIVDIFKNTPKYCHPLHQQDQKE